VIAANPAFAGSTRLPADGDLIVRSRDGSGFLIDFKSAKSIEPASMLMVVRQILTYALMDESDEYEIGHVGFTSPATERGRTGDCKSFLMWVWTPMGQEGREALRFRSRLTRIDRRCAGCSSTCVSPRRSMWH
jgi:hypothetical protein